MERKEGKAQEKSEKESNDQGSSSEEGSDEQAETAEGTNKLHPVIFPGIEQPQKPEFKSQEEKEKGLKTAEEKYKEGCALNKEGKLPEAIDALYEALEIRIVILGDRAPQCAQVYQKLGEVLLALGRERANDFSSALIKKRLKEKMGVSEQQPSAPKSKPAQKNTKIDVSDSEDEDEDEEDEDEVVAGGQGEDYLDESWKMLESARVIYSDHRAAHLLELSDVYQSLGDLGLELELKPEETLREYTECLRLRDAMPADAKGRDRLLAEAHFSLALAQQYHSDNAGAKENYRSALQYLQKRLAQIRNSASSSSSSSSASSGMTRGDDDEKPKKSPEEEELLAIIDDVQQKLDEVSDVAAQEKAKAALMDVLKPQQTQPLPAQQKQEHKPQETSFSTTTSSLQAQQQISHTNNGSSNGATPAPAAPVHVLGTFGRKRKPADGASTVESTTTATSPLVLPPEKKDKIEKS